MRSIILALGFIMLGCGEVTVAEVDAMIDPVDPAPVQCEQCERLCPETGWGIAYADIFWAAGSLNYDGFAAFVNTGADALRLHTPTMKALIKFGALDLQVQAGTEPIDVSVKPKTGYGAVDMKVANMLTETKILSVPLVGSSNNLLT